MIHKLDKSVHSESINVFRDLKLDQVFPEQF